ncbi:MAG: insulinase family protein [Alphaproteobacteria bacterium]|nr:insulinase family protein [Alphaproteobacteria bacterium SS10]
MAVLVAGAVLSADAVKAQPPGPIGQSNGNAAVSTPDWANLAGSLLDNVPDSIFEPETFTLDNGLEVVVVTNDRAPVTIQMLWYKVGSADDPRGRSGLAHFVEHLMFKGTERLGPGEFSEMIAAVGGTENAFTSYDFTGYFQIVAKEHLPTMMEFEADRMTNLALAPEQVDSERKVIAEERRQVVDSRPSRRLGEAMDAVLFAGSPYWVPVIGWTEDIDNLRQEDVERFYEQWYAPNNAILVLAGDVTVDEARKLAERYYGAIPASDQVPERTRHAPQPMQADALITMRDPQVERPSWVRSTLMPENMLRTEPEAYALTVLGSIMSDGTTSRLRKPLVFDQKVALSIGMFSRSRFNSGYVTLYGEPTEAHTLEELEAAVDVEIARLLEDGVTAEEVEAAQERLLASAIFARDGLNRPARTVGNTLVSGYTIEDLESWAVRISEVTPELVNEVAAQVFNQQKSVTGFLLPDDDAGASQ